MLTNDDRDFFEQLNRTLAKEVAAAVSKGGGGSDSATKENTDATKDNTKTSKVSAAGVYALTTTTRALYGIYKSQLGQGKEFGDILGRAAVASNRQALLGVQVANNQQKFANAIPNVSMEFARFGTSVPKAASMIRAAIESNIKDTNAVTQKFIATSTGLGGSIASTNRFLATQTNVLGTSTESSVALGESLLGMANANGILVDALYDATEAFKDTTKKQQALLGPEAAAEVQRIVAGLEALAPGAGMGELVRALTSPEALLTLPAFASTIGIQAPQNMRDPAQVGQFVLDAIQGLAQFQQTEISGADPLAAFRLSENLSQAFNEAFNLTNLQRASNIMEQAGGNLEAAMSTSMITSTEMADKQRLITGTSQEAADAMSLFATTLAGIPDRFNALDAANEALRGMGAASDDAAQKVRDFGGDLFQVMNTLETHLDRFGLGVGDIVRDILALTGLGTAARRLLPRGGAAGAAGGAAQGARAATRPNIRFNEAAGRFQGPNGFISNQEAQRLTGTRSAENARRAVSRGGKLARGATRVGGAALSVAGGALTAFEEFEQNQDVSRAVTRGVATTGGGVGGAALGATIGTVILPGVGTVLGGIVGGLLGAEATDAVATGVHDYFDDEFTAEQAAREQDILQGQIFMQEQRDAAWEERQQARHQEFMELMREIESNTRPREPEPTSAYRVQGFGFPQQSYNNTADTGGY